MCCRFVLNYVYHGIDDKVWRREIGVAHAKVYEVDALRLGLPLKPVYFSEQVLRHAGYAICDLHFGLLVFMGLVRVDHAAHADDPEVAATLRCVSRFSAT